MGDGWRSLKNWGVLALVAVGLAYVLAAQFVMYERRGAQESAASVSQASVSPPPHPKPAAQRAPQLAFGGYPCRADCADDKAGYAWAKNNAVTDPDDCTGKTGAFIEGCRVYARQQIADVAGY